MNIRILASLLLIAFSFFSCNKQSTVDEANIKKLTENYAQAFNKHDPKVLAGFFAADGAYVKPESGIQIQGTNNLEEFFGKSKDSNLELDIGNIKFKNTDRATVTGTFRLKDSDNNSDLRAFKLLVEKENGKWVIGEIRDVALAIAPNQYEHLKELEWLIGDFVDQDEDVEINFSNKWDITKNLILGKFSVSMEDDQALEGTYIIAWDPVKEKIHSWFFDSDGGFGEAIWNKKDNAYVVETVQTLADGRRGSSVNIYTSINSSGYTWESTNREIGGELLPDIEPVIIKRKGS